MTSKYGRCLRLPALTRPSSTEVKSIPRATFATSATNLASPAKPATGSHNAPRRGSKATLSPSKRGPRTTAKAKSPDSGERKAVRKKIVWSNPNALDVPQLVDISAENVLQPDAPGRVMGIPSSAVDCLRTLGSSKATQSWKFYRRPCVLIREETRDLAGVFHDVDSTRSSDQTLRKVIVGERGSGKSMHLLQAIALASLKNWVVISIPEAQDLTIGHTDYTPLPGASPPIYIQRTYTADLLTRVSAANPILRTLRTTLEHNLPVPIPSNISLARLCSIGADPSLAHPVFLALVAELSAPGRPPLLLSLDGLPHAMRFSDYRSASFEPIHAHSLFLVSWFLSYLSGHSALPNGGIVLAAMSHSNCPSVPTLRFGLDQLEARKMHPKRPASHTSESLMLPFLEATRQEPGNTEGHDRFFQHDPRVLQSLGISETDTSAPMNSSASIASTDGAQCAQILRLKGLAPSESHSLMQYWAQSGMMRNEINDRISAGKWAASGSGLVGELEKGCVSLRM